MAASARPRPSAPRRARVDAPRGPRAVPDPRHEARPRIPGEPRALGGGVEPRRSEDPRGRHAPAARAGGLTVWRRLGFQTRSELGSRRSTRWREAEQSRSCGIRRCGARTLMSEPVVRGHGPDRPSISTSRSMLRNGTGVGETRNAGLTCSWTNLTSWTIDMRIYLTRDTWRAMLAMLLIILSCGRAAARDIWAMRLT